MFSIVNTVLLVVICIRLFRSGTVVNVTHKHYYQPDARAKK